MRSITKNSVAALAVVSMLVACLLGNAVHGAAQASPGKQAQQGGVTITPATLTLTLAKGAAQQDATFSITNNYAVPVALHLAFAQPVATPGNGSSALKQLAITPADVSIAPGETAKPVLTLTDDKALAPGSQQVELVISQLAAAGANVNVVPSVRMPLSIIKMDGAVAKLSASDITKPGYALRIPEKVELNITNTGNIITIPRGYVTVRDPRGHTVSKGIINNRSAAVTPGSRLQVSTALTMLGHAWLPGVYRIDVTYGLGGGAAAQTASASFFYLPLWHILLVGLLGAMAYCGRQIWRETRRLAKQRAATAAGKPKAAPPRKAAQ